MTYYVLEATSPKGEFLYYTGRAGEGWVSPEISEAFRCEQADFAAYRARQFNARSSLTGLTFSLLAREPKSTRLKEA